MRVGVLILGEERRDFFQRRISIVDDESQKLYELIDCSGYELLKLGIVFTYKQARIFSSLMLFSSSHPCISSLRLNGIV